MAFKYSTTSPTELIFKEYNMLNYNNMIMVQASKHNTIENPNGFRYSTVTSDVVVFAQYTNLQLKTNTNYIVEFMAYIETDDDNLRQGMDIDLIPDDLPQYNIQFDANGISNKPKKFTITFNSSSSNMSSCSLRFFIDFTNSSGLRVVAPLVVYDIKFYEEGVLTTTNLTVLKYGIKGYTVLDYIKSTGTQYIDIGYKFSGTVYDIYVVAETSQTSKKMYMYTCVNTSTNSKVLDVGINSNGTIFRNVTEGASSSGNSTSETTNYNKQLKVRCWQEDGTTNYFQVNTGTKYGVYQVPDMSECKTYIFHYPTYDSNNFIGKLYKVVVFDNGNLISTLIPAKRDSDGAIGIYDYIGENFYTNSGTGDFIAGNEIGGFPVWGKPYALSISKGTGVSYVTVNRISSPNQDASLGSLSNGSVIYYGDVITVSYTLTAGYGIDTHTINGINFTSGEEFTVTSAINIVTTAIETASWHTTFTGTSSATNSSTSSSSTIELSPQIIVSTGAIKIRVNGSYTYSGSTTAITDEEVSAGSTLSFNYARFKLATTKGSAMKVTITKASSILKPSTFKLTKVEEYY